jgi:hypothetical protein
LLFNVPWDDYEQFCNLCDGHNIRLAYDRGTLEMFSPSGLREERLSESKRPEIHADRDGATARKLRSAS